MGNKEERHANKFQKAFFRALCVGVLGLLGVRDYGQEPNLKELVLLGMKNYKEQDFSQAKEF
ncbi:hypothetical protein Taitung222_01130 [Helicobacter pylori]